MKNIKPLFLVAFAAALTAGLPSCTTPSSGCQKCIDQKPAPTTFSTQLNARNHNIPLSQAISMTNTYRMWSDSLLAGHFRGNSYILPVHETFNLKTIDSLICQPNVIGLRIYMAMDPQQNVRFVLTGVDPQGKDIIQQSTEPGGMMVLPEGSGMVAEAGQRWP